MQKKLLAVAVAGALAAPGVALAQSSVTISGVFKISAEHVSVGNFNPSTTPANFFRFSGANSSYNRLADDSSRIIFNVTEDLGGGLAAIGQLDIRFKFDDGGTAAATNVGGAIGAGNTWVGLRSKAWGQLTFGRNDLHYFNTESDITTKAVSLRQDPISLLAYVQGQAIANASRSQNVVRWLSPNWGGFTMIVAGSTNTPGNDADLGALGRKGNAWNLNPNFQAANFQVGYSYWRSKQDATAGTITVGTVTIPLVAPTLATGNQRADRLYGSFKWAGFKIGLAWDRSKIEAATNGNEIANRTAWSIPVGWSAGNHNVYAHYTKARSDKSSALTATQLAVPGAVATVNTITVPGICGPAALSGPALSSCNTGAKMWAIGYVYDMSKRTSVGISYSRIQNDNGATYNHFTTLSLGDAAAAIAPGEDPRILAATIRHAF